MRKVLFCLFILIFTFSCTTEKCKNTFTVITWNSYLFFDSRDDGWEYKGYRREDGYSDSVYKERVRRCALMMAKSFSSADVIILQEIESANVLEDILSAGLKKKGFRYYGIASNGESPLSVGYISRYKPESIAFHGTAECRNQLEMNFFVNGEYIHILALHARSNLSDDGEDYRYAEFSLARTIMDSFYGECALLVGDFNADPRVSEKGLSNIKLCSDDKTPLVVSGDPGECIDGVFFSPSLDYMNDVGHGTYFYKSRWYWFDNILMQNNCFDMHSWDYDRTEILYPEGLADSSGFPIAYDKSTSRGFSDHLPLMCVLKYY